MTDSQRLWLYYMLTDSDPQVLEALLDQADQARRENRGDEVYLRGLIEFSNYCQKNCYYCGLRRSNQEVLRYRMSRKEIVEQALAAQQLGFQSLALQSGEVHGKEMVDFLVQVIADIKELSSRDGSPGLGITLSVGELSYADYRRLWEAGAHRYLLRTETSDPELFAGIHPPSQSLQSRLDCLQALQDIGFQVGTGIMVGLPGQTIDHLLADLQFFMDMNIDMAGLGPYLPHPQTPMGQNMVNSQIDPWLHTIKIMALTRILMPDINMVASTALQSLHPQGLRWGLKAGANVVMPVMTPAVYREQYRLYSGKQYKSFKQIQTEIEAAGYRLGLWKWGDSLRWSKRQEHSQLTIGEANSVIRGDSI